MCGIFGILLHADHSIPDHDKLRSTVGLLAHRGPDYSEVFAAPGIGLAHTRLSLLDLSPRSHQPFWDRARRYCLVYNGEIYNFRELRQELESEGVGFRTSSDTEVLLEGLIRWGADHTLRRLEGMFAFGLYDTAERSLLLARDRFGIKPLHFYEGSDRLVFASEVQALRPWIPWEPDVISISAFVNGHGGPMTGPGFLKGVRTPLPGSIITVRHGGAVESRRFFSLSELWDPEESRRLKSLRPEDAVEETDRLLCESVRLQLIADAPVGALCSGGVDSSLIMAIAARNHKDLAIFHANVVGKSSELKAAVALARHLDLHLETVDVVDADFIERLPEVTRHYGLPFTYHPNSVPFLMVSKLVRKNGVKAVLSGEGSDECFLGYSWTMQNPVDFLTALPRRPLATLRKLARSLMAARRPSPHKDGVAEALGKRFESDAEVAEVRAAVEERFDRSLDDTELLSASWMTYHLRTLLHRNDALGMAASIEARFPYLDSNVARLAANLPYEYKVRYSRSVSRDVDLQRDRHLLRDKWVIRQVADRYLPAHLARRPKQGFPTSAFGRMKVSGEFLHGSFVSELFGLGDSQVSYFDRHADRGIRLRLLQLEVWARVVLLDQPADAVVSWIRQHATIQPEQPAKGKAAS
ncbi:MAG: hypothetical protein AMS21_08405 [Gemmatimonas sp. SG8_38_2]|nr:MAG: hypothetical protein AMS21_08405 [Gemmatimonas sp. SG8_38_2]